MTSARGRYGSGGRSFSGEDGGLTSPGSIPRGHSITSRDSSCPNEGGAHPDDAGESFEYDGYSLLLTGLLSVFDLLIKSSYICTNIIMMAWSITYHSWLTFILLLWACVLWMFPNQRRAMLVSSPGLVFYAEVLLFAQYIYSLNLTDDELPQNVDGVNLAEIGLVKPTNEELPFHPILVKPNMFFQSLYTLMFWVTLRQFVMEKKSRRAVIEDAAQESFRITVTTTTTELQARAKEQQTKPTFMTNIGNFIKDVLTKFWIWVVAIMLFVIGLGGEEVVLYRIVYMALFLIFILTFQLSYGAWRKMMYGFWLTVIVYSMLILVLIYTYQFAGIPVYLSNYTGIPEKLQKDIGLEKFDTGDLFVRLLTPTFFVVITVIQLHYFHQDFLKLSEFTRPNQRPAVVATEQIIDDETDKPPNLVDEFNFKNFMRTVNYYGTRLIKQTGEIYIVVSEISWRVLEIHIMKVVLFSALALTVFDKCALHLLLFLGVVGGVIFQASAQRLMIYLCSIFISFLLLVKMIYQINYISHENWNDNCSEWNITRNDAEWLGLNKIDEGTKLPSLLKEYIGIIFVVTVQAVVQIRQKYQRFVNQSPEPGVGILFDDVRRKDADLSLIQCTKFLLNYGFYKFGVEITLITLVAVIGTRLDIFSVLYTFWLIPMFYYPWKDWDIELKTWLFLPDEMEPPLASRLIPDFILLLFACQQRLVFLKEHHATPEELLGGTNDEVMEATITPNLNPTPDFLTSSRTPLDIIKKCIFLSFYWITLAIIFLSGTNRVNLFALGYLVGSFIFLWEGNEFYLRTKKSIIKRWNYLLAYNVFVIFSKSVLQLIGCIFLNTLQFQFCWLVQLFGIACLNKFHGSSEGSGITHCEVPHDEAGLVWDGITFAFLLFQRRIFNSYYFFHIRGETEVQALLASRGAELIEELMQKQIRQQEEEEKDVLEKIKMKMERIKATHHRRQKGPQNHFDGTTRMDPVSSMASSPISMDEIAEQPEDDEPISPRAPLAVQISITSGPTPTPSSAAMTISVDGFFEPPYGRHPQDSLLHPPHLPLSPSDESFPVFSPPPESQRYLPSGLGGERGKSAIGVQTEPPSRSFYSSLHSPALSHHTSIRSGDYYMFEEVEDDDMAMIDSITEEDEDSEDRPAGFTLSELMSSALKSDVEQATEMARLARRSSVIGEGSITESIGAGPTTTGGSLIRRRSRKKLSRRGTAQRKVSTADHDAPLAGAEDYSYYAGAAAGSDDEIAVEEQTPKPPPSPTIMRRIIGYIRFAWAILESLMVSATTWLNKFSKDYRHVSKCLSREKLLLKEQELNQLSQNLQEPIVPPRQPEVELSFEDESRGSGDVGSKDDLNTVIEKPSPVRDIEEFKGSSLDSLSEIEEDDIYGPFICFCVSVWYVIISHSDLVCYFVVFLNQIKSSSILSLPLPLMVLLWGTLSVPRPTKTFWVTIIAYTEAMVVIKYLFQFDFFPWNEKSKQVNTKPFWPPKILGIEKQEKYAMYDVILLMIVFFHRFMLKSLGLWKNKGSTVGSAETFPKSSHDSTKSTEDTSLKRDDTISLKQEKEENGEAGNESDLTDGSTQEQDGLCAQVWEQWQVYESFQYGPQFLKLCVLKYLSSIRVFFNQILKLEYKVKVDVYSYMFMCDFFNFLVVIFGFASFGSQQGDVSSYLEENKVPVPFLVMVILQFGLIVIDRALYLRKDIMGKFVFQIALVTLVHIAMFFILPSVTERDFNANLPPQMWYMVKCVYLLFSAYQIRSGYPTRILGNFLCKKYNYVNMFLFKGFMGVPFLFELRALMDWIWTDTSMTLSDWLKLEDIFAHIFQLKCQRRAEKEYPQGRGLPKQRMNKYTIGGSSLFSIIAIIWFPLVLFALGNTVGLPNRPLDVSLEISIGSYQPIYTMSAQRNSLIPFTVTDWTQFNYDYRRDKAGQNFLSNYEFEDAYVAQLNGNSSSVWGISPPAKDKLIEELQSDKPVSVRISWTIARESNNPPSTQPIAIGKGEEVELLPDDDNRKHLMEMINGTATKPVKIKAIFPKFLKVKNSGKAEVANDLTQGLLDMRWRYNLKKNKNSGGKLEKVTVLRNLTLTLKTPAPNQITSQDWWVIEEDCQEFKVKEDKIQDLPKGDECHHLNIYTFNEKAFPPTLSFISGGGIIGLYTTLVLVASKFVRSYFAGISFLIMFDDMPNVDRILQLTLDIYLVRESGELALEEDLFAKLIFLYRSPETLIKWTRPKTIRADGEEGGDSQAIERA
ncbi:Piezo-type mechanosensitive ion channel component 2 [Orchesella cincta]|uniref:Piezo-type mechanosensitive ion channel component 2 n=1 Tax=Orchesella cincta TaxID=48709 RepID=A0A1D2MY89_ORCCI|nr:Piezo-type mechanosensitive ion channel component 2 [Orchesella cincta]